MNLNVNLEHFLEFWSVTEIHEENLKRITKSVWKDERYNLWVYQKVNWTPSWWILGHKFGAILGLAFVEEFQNDYHRSEKLKLKAERRAKWQKIKTLEICSLTPVTTPTHTPITTPPLPLPYKTPWMYINKQSRNLKRLSLKRKLQN